jgi:hypothetical protein
LKKFKAKYEAKSKQPEPIFKGNGIKKKTNEEELYGGELEDIWGSKKEVKSNNFATYIAN